MKSIEFLANQADVQPLVSIIIPSYNSRRYVCEAIESALAQSYPNCEIIVVDDGSDDGTRDLLAAKYNYTIRYVYQQNRGLSGARNMGLSLAQGEFVQFLDADDLLHPDKVACHVRCLQENPDVDVVYSDFAWFPDGAPDELTESGFHERYQSGHIWNALLKGNFIVSHTPLSRLTVLKEVGGFDENLPACEDYDLWLRLAYSRKKFLIIPKILAYYRTSSNSMSSNLLRQHLANIQTLKKVLLYALLDTDEEWMSYSNHLIAVYEHVMKLLIGDALCHFREDRIDQACDHVRRALDIAQTYGCDFVETCARALLSYTSSSADLEYSQFLRMALSNLNHRAGLVPLLGKVIGRIHKLQASKYCFLGDSAKAGRHALRALIHDPSQASDPMLISVLAELLLGNELFSAIKGMLEKKEDSR